MINTSYEQSWVRACAILHGRGVREHERVPLLQEWKFALFVLPYISVVAEKAAHFTDILHSSGCKCKGFYVNSENGTPLQPGYSTDLHHNKAILCHSYKKFSKTL